MSGLNRSASRQALRAKYERFCLAWRREKDYQRYLIANGSRVADGKIAGPPGKPEIPLLGRKPTFAMWMAAERARREAAAEELRRSTQVEVTDTDWEE